MTRFICENLFNSVIFQETDKTLHARKRKPESNNKGRVRRGLADSSSEDEKSKARGRVVKGR